MKSTTIPPLRVSPELRRKAEALLQEGETLSSFVLDAMTRSIELREAQQAFVARGLANSARARQTGQYVPADKLVAKLERRLAVARKRSG